LAGEVADIEAPNPHQDILPRNKETGDGISLDEMLPLNVGLKPSKLIHLNWQTTTLYKKKQGV
jgi:hypothetical protein